MQNLPVRLPSLDLVRGFIAVGRRMSITLAAEDLFLTQSAVSRPVIALEAALGVKLLNRGYRSIDFNPGRGGILSRRRRGDAPASGWRRRARRGAGPSAGDDHRDHRRLGTMDHAALG
jgi:DNA-binding transcriptional LysR family regulator